MEEPKKPRDIIDVIDWIGWDRLMYSSDYPHWDYDDAYRLFRFPVEDEQRDAVLSGNASKLYGYQ